MSLAGTRLGPYQIVTLLGAGGMGEVYRARDTKLGRDVAIKVLPASLASDPERRARFEREARLLASLNHPNIAAIYGVEETGGVTALVLELVKGQTLADRIGARGVGLGAGEAISIATQIADALDAAHERGIVHRDLKPANVVITPDGTVKVLDFGLAKAGPGGASAAGGSGTDEGLTHSPTVIGPTVDGVLLGTAPYMSPEQARGKAVDKRTDIWAFGCVLYEMLTGRRAFGGETTSDTVAAILEREPDWTRLPASTPPYVRRLLKRCLQRDLKHRARDIGDVRAEIEDEVDIGTTRERPLRAWRLATLTLASVLLIVAVVVALIRARSTPAADDSTSRTTAAKLTDYGGAETSAAIAPDGRSFAFVSDHGGSPDIWLRQVAGGEPVRLSNDVAVETDLAFAADGESIFFTRTDESGDAIWQIGVLGGHARKVIAVAHTPSPSPDGRLAFLTREPNGAESLVVSGLDGSGRRTLAEHIPSFPAVRSAWSHSGRLISFTRAGLFAPSNLFVVDVTTGGERQVTHFARPGGVAKHVWLPDDRHLAVAYSGSTGTPVTYALGLLDTQDGSISRVMASITDSFGAPSISADGSRLVATSSHLLREVWKVPSTSADPDFNGRGAVRVIEAAKDPLWTFVTRDGRLLLFNSPATGSRNLWTMPLDGSAGARQITAVPGDAITHSSLSPDGTRIAFVSLVGGTSHIWTQNVDGSGARPLTDNPTQDSWPVWSPDGRSIVFSSGRGANQETRVISAEGGPSEKLVDGFFRGDWVQEPGGGTRIVTNSFNSDRVRLLDVERRTVVWDKPVGGSSNGMPVFSADGRSISVSVQEGPDHDVIETLDAETGMSRLVARLPFTTIFRVNWIDAAFLVNRNELQSHIVLFEHFWLPRR